MDKESAYKIIATAVMDNVTVKTNTIGSTGLGIRVSELVLLSQASKTEIYNKLLKQNIPSEDSLYGDENSPKQNLISRQIELLKAMAYLEKISDTEAKAAAAIRKSKTDKLALLKKAKEAKDIEAINKLSAEDLDKELAALTANEYI